MYTLNKNQYIILVDCDDTLVTFDPIEGVMPLSISKDGNTLSIYPIEVEINRLKEAKIRGHWVRVHSKAGSDWGERVIKLLNLENFVDSIEAKPFAYHDDMPADKWMIRFYEGPKKERKP